MESTKDTHRHAIGRSVANGVDDITKGIAAIDGSTDAKRCFDVAHILLAETLKVVVSNSTVALERIEYALGSYTHCFFEPVEIVEAKTGC